MMSWEEKHKHSNGEWTSEVVYEIYKNDDLNALPTLILKDMVKHLNNTIEKRVGNQMASKEAILTNDN